MSNELTLVDPDQQNALANVDYGDDGGAGFDNTTAADFKVPWLRVLSSNSPQVDSVEGAKAGKIINTITNALFDSIYFIPAITEHYYVEWKPRNEGGGGGAGFVAAHKAESQMVQNALAQLGDKWQRGADGKLVVPKSPAGNDLIETYYVHGIQVIPETNDVLAAIISFYSTGIPVYQNWMTTARNQTYLHAQSNQRKSKPLFSHVYKLGTVKEEKNGYKWHKFTFAWANGSALASALPATHELYRAGQSVRALVLEGAAKVDHSNAVAGGGDDKTRSEGSQQRAGGGRDTDSEIPF